MTTVLTGDRPTGPLHLGHYVGSIKNRLMLQNTLEHIDQARNLYLIVADTQALTDNFDNADKINSNIIEVVKDYLAVGIDPKVWKIFLQSEIKELFELTIYLMNLVKLNNLSRIPTLKEEILQKNYEKSIPMGFLNYPISQAADLLLFDADSAPVGIDQVPIIEFVNDLARDYNRIYNVDRFKTIKADLSDSPKLMGLDGKSKASKSLSNAIFLKDDEAELKKKINQMYTDPNHLKISDPGEVKGNVVFMYLNAFYEDKSHLKSLEDQYTSGGLGDGELKKLLFSVLNELLSPIRQKRNAITHNQIIEALEYGQSQAKEVARSRIEIIREDIGYKNLYKLNQAQQICV